MKGIMFALLAAICNSCIGIFSSLLMEQGLTSIAIAFLRCLAALLFTFLFCIVNANIRKKIKIKKKDAVKYIILAFFGINIMYIFETTAIQYIPISIVSFLLYASGILTIILSCIFFNEHMNKTKIISIVIVFLGIGIMFITNLKISGSLIGVIFAIIAGTGYSLYIFLNKKWGVQSGMVTLLYVFLFGTIFLGIQVFISDTIINIELNNIPFIILLAIVPTMGGFYFTNKAINYAMAGEVQLVEMSEPFIATILGFVILKQMISYTDLIGGIFIIVGLVVLEKDNIMVILKSREASKNS